MLVTFFRYVGDFLNVLNRSPAHLVSNIRHQHRYNLFHGSNLEFQRAVIRLSGQFSATYGRMESELRYDFIKLLRHSDLIN